MRNTFFISDLHVGHARALEFRPEFPSLDDMHDMIIENWNTAVSAFDTVVVLGDVFFCNKTFATEFLNRLNGAKVLVKGNHDDKSDDWYKDVGFSRVRRGPVMSADGLAFFSHIPITWNKTMRKRVVNVHGHLHGQGKNGHRPLPDSQGRVSYVDVSVEATNYTPVSSKELGRRFPALNHVREEFFTFCVLDDIPSVSQAVLRRILEAENPLDDLISYLDKRDILVA